MCWFTVKRGVSRLMSSRETSMAITPRMSWLWNFWDFWKTESQRKKNKKQQPPVSPVVLRRLSNPMVSDQFQGNGAQAEPWTVSIPFEAFACRHESQTRYLQPSFRAAAEATPASSELDTSTHLEAVKLLDRLSQRSAGLRPVLRFALTGGGKRAKDGTYILRLVTLSFQEHYRFIFFYWVKFIKR